MTVSIHEIEELYQVLFNETVEQRINQCSRITEQFRFALEDIGIESRGCVVRVSYNGSSDTHRILEVSEEQIEDVSEGPIYLDPTVSQFAKKFYDEGRVQVYLPEEEITDVDTLKIISPSDTAHEYYTRLRYE